MKSLVSVIVLSLVSFSALAELPYENFECYITKVEGDGFPPQLKMNKVEGKDYHSMNLVDNGTEFRIALVKKSVGPQANYAIINEGKAVEFSSQQMFKEDQFYIDGPIVSIDGIGYGFGCENKDSSLPDIDLDGGFEDL